MAKKYITIYFLSLFLFAKKTLAVCPVCTVAVGAGLGLSRWLGIDDTITGLWVGGFIVSISLWTLNFFKKRQITFWGKKIITPLFYYLITLLPLYYNDITGHPLNILWGVDKFILGVGIGSIFFYFGGMLYEYFKKKNGHAHFPFEKVVMPIVPLIILSIIFYYLTK